MWDKMETPTIVYDLDTSGGLMEVNTASDRVWGKRCARRLLEELRVYRVQMLFQSLASGNTLACPVAG